MTRLTHQSGVPADSGEITRSGLLTPAQLADFLGVDRDYVYAHADELGAWRLGAGPRARLRFDLEEVRRRLTACPAGRESDAPATRTVEPKVRRRCGPGLGSGVELLPIRGSVVPRSVA